MFSVRFFSIPVLLVYLLLAGAGAAGANESAVTAHHSDAAIVLDGNIDPTEWRGAGLIADLVQQDPVPGGPMPYRTEVRFLRSDDKLFVAIRCYDPDPAGIVVKTMSRDGDFDGQDYIAIVLDTFQDRRSGFLFRVNAGGARQDGLVSGPENYSLDWDGIWDVAVSRDAHGWSAELEIPARTLRFQREADEWGLNVERFVARDRLRMRWQGTTLNAKFYDLSQAGTISGMSDLQQGLGLSIVPYAIGRRNDDLTDPAADPDYSRDAGFDLSYNITPDLAAVLSVNTDFAETEVDDRQVNLTRFPLFFPEKRQFFLEGSDVFSFGLGLGSNFMPFYSRRIGLVSGRQVPLDAGVRLLGRSGRFNISLLGTEMSETDVSRETQLFAGRVTYDVDDSLRVGMLTTVGDPTGREDNSLLAVDAVWQTSEFLQDRNLALGIWGARSFGDLKPGDASGWGFKLDYPNDLLDANLVFNQYGGALDPKIGFLPRTGVRVYSANLSYQPRPGEAIPWIRQFYFENSYSRYVRFDGTVESWDYFTAPLNVSFESGDRIEWNWSPEHQRIDEPFEVTDGVVIPPGEYGYNRWRLEGETSEERPLKLELTWWFGEFYTGSLDQYEADISCSALDGALQFGFQIEHNVGDLPQGKFTQRVYQVKGVYAYSTDISLTSYLQYDSESRDLGLSNRMRWQFEPGKDLFIMWNRNWRQMIDLTGPNDFEPQSDQLLVKLRWTLRM